MNVLDLLETRGEDEVPPLNADTLESMLTMRKQTYTGFAALESEKGFLKPETRFASSQGQEMIRILLMRFFEELTEAHEATDPLHVQEELIDALNYLWTLAIIDPTCPLPWPRILEHEFIEHLNWGHQYPPAEYEIGKLMLYATFLLSTLRNRPWQNNPQSLYFDGWKPLGDFIAVATRYTIEHFEGWESFYRVFSAKDAVLQFRITTRY